jgi:hypothetical protein
LSAAPAGDAPYLHHGAYWVAADQAADYPVRQGDLFSGVRVGGELWDAALIVHPTCELGKSSVTEVQVARVHSLARVADVRQRARVVAGFAEVGGVVRLAFAHTFFVAPVTDSALDEPMWANLREIGSAARTQFTAAQRIGALTHDARVTFIRRYLYFRFRLALSFEQIRALEAARIRADPAFSGPKPSWAM